MKFGWRRCCGILLEYETEKVVQINSVKVGLISRLIQLLLIGYLIGWVLLYKKGYQETDTLVSGVVTKVKGVTLTNRSDIGQRVWDVADYIVPPQERDAVFITTNAIITPGQVQGKCPEDPTVPGAQCTTDTDCKAGEPIMLGNGIKTGRCVDTRTPDNKNATKSCEIYAWCPIENDHLPQAKIPLLSNIVNYTVLVKNSIEFPKFQKKRHSLLPWFTSDFLKDCRYNATHPRLKYCPIFTLDSMLPKDPAERLSLLTQGGVIAMSITWVCNFDWADHYCNPKYSFRRLDEKDSKIAKGWNFRYANYYTANGTQSRDMFKVYGIRILIYVTGEAGRFSFVPFTMNLGSGMALFAFGTFVCDMIVLYCLSKRDLYRDAKYQTCYMDDAIREDEETGTTLEGDAQPIISNVNEMGRKNEGFDHGTANR